MRGGRSSIRTWVRDGLVGIGLLLASVTAFAQAQCTAQQIQDFQTQCDQYGQYVQGLETACLNWDPTHYGCGFYPLPSEVRPTPTGLGCVVTWNESPSRQEGTAYSTYTGNQFTLDCSIPSNIPIPAKNASKSCSPQGDCGNPINVGVGNKHQHESDYAGAGVFPLRLDRTYNSNTKGKKEFTVGWRSAYGRTISYSTNGATGAARSSLATVVRGDGKQFSFRQTGAGAAWVGEADGRGVLSQLGADTAGAPTGWRYVSDRDEQEVYDASGTLISITHRTGLTQTLAYSCSVVGSTCPVVTPTTIAPMAGLLISVKDFAGRTLNFVYDGMARLIKMTDPAGGNFGYAYSDATLSANLKSVTYPDGKSRGYLYGEADRVASNPIAGVSYVHALTGLTDENGVRFASWSYDANGRATSSEHAVGIEKVSLTYNTDGSANVVDTLGTNRTYGYATALNVARNAGISGPPCNGCVGAITYDGSGNVSSQVDFNSNKVCYGYDLTRNLETARLEGLGSSANCPADAAAIGAYVIPSNLAPISPQRKVTTAWHPDWRLEVKRAEPKKLTTWVYNGQPDPTNGNAIASCAPSSALLPDGKPIAVLCKQVEQATTDTTGTLGFAATVTGTPRTSTWTYNSYGQVLTANGPRTDVTDTTTYTYYADTVFDGTGAGHTVGDLQSLTNAKGQVSTFTRYDRHGHPLEIQDANGNVTRLTYHPRGWLTSRSVGSASGTRETTQYDYDAVGQLKKVTNPDTSYIAYTYDDAHRLTDIADGKGNSIHYTVDAMGNRTKEEVKDPSGVLAHSQRSVYDALGRPKNLVTPQQ